MQPMWCITVRLERRREKWKIPKISILGSVNPDGETVTLDGDTVVWTGEEDVLTPEELEEFHRDAIKLMEESEQQKEVAIQG